MIKNIILLVIFLLAFSCETIQYVDDLKFINSASANSPEFPVFINGKLCKDIDGIPGLCSKRIKQTDEISITAEKQQYEYRIYIKCSKGTGVDLSLDIAAYTDFKYTIKPVTFPDTLLFTCLFEIYPKDREIVDPKNGISSLAEVRFVVVDPRYIARESMFVSKLKNDYYLVLGSNAKYSRVWDFKKDKQIIWNVYNQAAIKIHSPDKVKAMSESYMGRFNNFGFGD